MWISKDVYFDSVKSLLTAQAEAVAYKETNKALQTSLDWLRTRVTQLEKERAAFLNHYLDVKIPVPDIQKAVDPFESHPFNDMASLFNGMTDHEAKVAGIEHNESGEVVYTK